MTTSEPHSNEQLFDHEADTPDPVEVGSQPPVHPVGIKRANLNSVVIPRG